MDGNVRIAAHGPRADGAERERASRAGRDRRDRPPPAARPAARGLRRAARPHRPQWGRRQAGRHDSDRAPDGKNLGVARRAVKPLLVIDGDSLAHRAYHAMPKTVRLGRVLGFTNMVLRLWQAEEPRAVVIGWDSIGQT